MCPDALIVVDKARPAVPELRLTVDEAFSLAHAMARGNGAHQHLRLHALDGGARHHAPARTTYSALDDFGQRRP
jgi:hypothetical protein